MNNVNNLGFQARIRLQDKKGTLISIDTKNIVLSEINQPKFQGFKSTNQYEIRPAKKGVSVSAINDKEIAFLDGKKVPEVEKMIGIEPERTIDLRA